MVKCMNISPINNSNINQTSRKNPSFAGLAPFKVFVDGVPAENVMNTKRGFRLLENALYNLSDKSPVAKEVRQLFFEHDKEFRHWDRRLEKGKLIRRSRIYPDYIPYFFTYPQAGPLDELGREIGATKREGLENYGTTRTHAVLTKVRNYFAKIREFINFNHKAKIRERINPVTNQYEGTELGLHIFTHSEGIPGKKGYKLCLDSVKFRKIKDDPNSSVISEPSWMRMGNHSEEETVDLMEALLGFKPLLRVENVASPKTNRYHRHVSKARANSADWPAVKPKKPDEGPQGSLGFE